MSEEEIRTKHQLGEQINKTLTRKLENDLKKVKENEQVAYDLRDRAIKEKNELMN